MVTSAIAALAGGFWAVSLAVEIVITILDISAATAKVAAFLLISGRWAEAFPWRGGKNDRRSMRRIAKEVCAAECDLVDRLLLL